MCVADEVDGNSDSASRFRNACIQRFCETESIGVKNKINVKNMSLFS